MLLLMACGSGKEVIEKDPGSGDQQFRLVFHAAIQEKMIGNYDKSVALFEQCLVLKPESDAAHFALSDLYEKVGDNSKAVHHAEKAHELDKENRWYILRLANLYYDLGHYHKSAGYFALVIDQEKELETKFKYTYTLIYSNQNQKAIDMLDQIELETGKIPEVVLTKHDLYITMGEEEKAGAELDAMFAENPGNIEYKVIVAEYFIQTNQTTKAEKMAREVIEMDPTNGSMHVVLADIALRNNDLDAAFDHLENAMDKEDVSMERKLELIWSLVPFAFQDNSPDAERIEKGVDTLFSIVYDEESRNDQLFNYYGIFLLNQNKPAQARTQFRMAIELNPDSFNAWTQLLNSSYDLKDYATMLNDGQKAIELFPAQPMMYLLTGIAAYESGAFEEAEEWLYLGKDLVVRDDELLSEFLYHLGKTSCLQKKYDEGYKYLDEALVKFPANYRASGAKAKFLSEQERFDEAEMTIESALDRNPINPVLLDIYGMILFSQEKYSLASEKFQKAQMNDPMNAGIAEHYGDALYLSGNKEAGIEQWKKSAELGNETELLKRKIADGTYYEK